MKIIHAKGYIEKSLVVFLIAILCYYLYNYVVGYYAGAHPLFVDIEVYLNGTLNYLAGTNPYLQSYGESEPPLSSQPLVLIWFAFIEKHFGLVLSMTLFHIISFAYFLKSFLTINTRLNYSQILLIILSTALFALSGFLAFVSANIGMPLQFLCFAFFFNYLHANQLTLKKIYFALFLLTLLIGVMIKPPFLLMALLLLCRPNLLHQIKLLILFTIVCVVLYTIAYWSQQDLFPYFIESSSRHFKEDVLSKDANSGVSTLVILNNYYGITWAWTGHIALALVGGLLLYKRITSTNQQGIYQASLYMTVYIYTLVSPRIQPYDFIFALIALFTLLSIKRPIIMYVFVIVIVAPVSLLAWLKFYS